MGISPSSVTQNGVTATLTLSGSTVTVTVSSTNLSWRINGTNSGGDHGTYYIQENRNYSGTFIAQDGHSYAFQVCSSSGTWSNGSIFTVSFGGSGSGGSSGGDNTGGTVSTTTILYVNAGVGCSVSVKLVDVYGNLTEPTLISLYDYNDYFQFYGRFYRYDNLKIEVSAIDGYELDSYGEFNYDVENATYNSSNDTWEVKYNAASVEIYVTATPVNPDINIVHRKAGYLSAITDAGVNLNISRTKTSDSAIADGSYIGELTNGKHAYCNGYHRVIYPIWAEDYFIVQTELLDGYVLSSIEHGGHLLESENSDELYLPSYGTWGQIEAFSVQVDKPESGGDIGGGTGSESTRYVYRVYIDNGTSWVPL